MSMFKCERYCAGRDATLTSLPGRDLNAFKGWLASLGTDVVPAGICQAEGGTAIVTGDVEGWGDRHFGFIGAYQGQMWKNGVGDQHYVTHECGWLWTNGRRGLDLTWGGKRALVPGSTDYIDLRDKTSVKSRENRRVWWW